MLSEFSISYTHLNRFERKFKASLLIVKGGGKYERIFNRVDAFALKKAKVATAKRC
jgi:hypothetical protein